MKKAFENLVAECDKSVEFYTKHLEKLRVQIALMEEGKRVIKKLDAKADLHEFYELENVNNFNGYITISALDLSVNLKNLVLVKSDWEKIFFIKNSYLIIHETINKLKRSKSSDFLKDSISKDYPSLQEQFDDLMNEIILFKNTPEYKNIEKVRHQTSGHIIDSLKKYYDKIRSLDAEVAGKDISRFMKISQKALNLSRDYAILSNERTLQKNATLKSEFKEKLEKINSLLKKDIKS